MYYYNHTRGIVMSKEAIISEIRTKFYEEFKFDVEDSVIEQIIPDYIKKKSWYLLPTNREEMKELQADCETKAAQLMYGQFTHFMTDMFSHETDDGEPRAYNTYWTISYHSDLGDVSFKMPWGADETEIIESFLQNIIDRSDNGINIIDVSDDA